MKIKVNGLIFDNLMIIDDEKTLQIGVETDDVNELSDNIVKSDTIEVLTDDDTLAYTLNGRFTQPYLVVDSSGKRVTFIRKDNSIDKLNSIMQPVSVVFVQMAQDGTLDDVTVSEHPYLFPEWTENWTGKAGAILRDGEALYRSLHDISTIAQNTKPSETPSMWKVVADPAEEYPMWVQPLGAFDTYVIGDKVSHADKHWISTVNNNVWEPGIYGWEEDV